MNTLTEIIEKIEKTIKEDTLEGTKELYKYLKQQDDYSISENDMLYLLRKKKELSGPQLTSGSKLFFAVLYDYTMKGIKKEEREYFYDIFFRYLTSDLSTKEEKVVINYINKKGIPNLKNAIERCKEIKNMFKNYVFNPTKKELGEAAHYINNNLTVILNGMEILKLFNQ
ncbi:MAG: hypothetical protein N3D84_02460 [Candidatus Woesearchaeota archaeon]|nr:hypothetical protein [Candidatus Woesearchaeota archaeon]